MLTDSSYNPDVLTCIANLSSDEVFTPPQLANRILVLPPGLWSDKKATFLDPGCKSGVFLREIAKRLDKGLEKQIPDRQKRINHIFKKQLYGVAITELTALLARRSVYCSKTANGKYSVCEAFDSPEGNIRISHLVDYPKLYDGFPGVKIRGGVSYFLWDRDYNGPCSVQTMWDGEPLGPPLKRRLDDYDVLVRRNEAVSILDKVRAYRVDGKPEPTLDGRVSSRKPFGFPTNFHSASSPKGLKEPVKLYGSQRISWVERSDIQQNPEWIDDWKVLTAAVQGTSAAVETKFLSNPIIAGPGEACTEMYLVAGRFDSEKAAQCYAAYLRTRFARFLVSLRKSTQHANRGVYAFVPDTPLNRDWTDEKLYKRYGLTKDEIAFIESMVRPMPAGAEDANQEASDE